MKDAVVVGGGIAGLTAAWRLRDLDTILLESEPCVGGRIRSFERDGHWVSVGAHMFPGHGSFLWELLDELRLERARIHGSLLGIAYRRKIVTCGYAETFPFRLPLSPKSEVWRTRRGGFLKQLDGTPCILSTLRMSRLRTKHTRIER